MDSDDLDRLSKEVVGAAIEVHRVPGPGLLEPAYEECLAWELGLLEDDRTETRNAAEFQSRCYAGRNKAGCEQFLIDFLCVTFAPWRLCG